MGRGQHTTSNKVQQTDGHRDYQTQSAQWANSVKMKNKDISFAVFMFWIYLAEAKKNKMFTSCFLVVIYFLSHKLSVVDSKWDCISFLEMEYYGAVVHHQYVSPQSTLMVNRLQNLKLSINFYIFGQNQKMSIHCVFPHRRRGKFKVTQFAAGLDSIHQGVAVSFAVNFVKFITGVVA